MPTSSYGDEQSSPLKHHSIRVFTRPFLDYSMCYPSPLEGKTTPEGVQVGIVCRFPKISSTGSLGYWHRIAAMRHKGGHVRVDGMRLLELCVNLLPEQIIQLPLSSEAAGKAYFKEWESVYLTGETLVFLQTGFVVPVTELQ